MVPILRSKSTKGLEDPGYHEKAAYGVIGVRMTGMHDHSEVILHIYAVTHSVMDGNIVVFTPFWYARY